MSDLSQTSTTFFNRVLGDPELTAIADYIARREQREQCEKENASTVDLHVRIVGALEYRLTEWIEEDFVKPYDRGLFVPYSLELIDGIDLDQVDFEAWARLRLQHVS